MIYSLFRCNRILPRFWRKWRFYAALRGKWRRDKLSMERKWRVAFSAFGERFAQHFRASGELERKIAAPIVRRRAGARMMITHDLLSFSPFPMKWGRLKGFIPLFYRRNLPVFRLENFSPFAQIGGLRGERTFSKATDLRGF